MKTPCPDSARLKELLDTDLPEEEQAELICHLDSCPGCQHSLEEAAGGPAALEVLRHLDEEVPPPQAAYWSALRHVEDLTATRAEMPTPAETPAPGRPTDEEIDLSFLGPAETPGTLGQLGHFDIESVIGQGGMGLVLKGFDGCLQRHVAIKVLDPRMARNDTARQRFCREARAAAGITHENVVAIHQVEREETADLPFLVMQLISGQSLQEYLDRGQPFEVQDIVRIGTQVASGLAAAHARGLVHRDIKPANILLENGLERVKLTDFGLARAAEDVRLTQSGLVVGTPLYMAPEQARGEETDHRTDLFSLGSVLYAMCTGKPPFEGSTPFVVLRQVTEEMPKPIRQLNPKIPDWLVEIIDKLMAKKPKNRFQSAAEVAELFGQHLALLQHAAPGSHPSGLAASPCKGKKGKKLLAGGVLFGLGGLAMALLIGLKSPKPETGPASRATLPRDDDSGAVWSVAFAPEGNLLASAGDDGKLRLWDLKTLQLRTTREAHQGPIWAVRFACEGTIATVSDDGYARLWDEARVNLLMAKKLSTSLRAVAISCDGRVLAAGGRDGSLHLFNIPKDLKHLSPNQEMKILWDNDRAHDGIIMSAAFGRDGKLLATGSGFDHEVKLWDVATKQLLLTIKRPQGGVYAVALSPDGKLVASAGYGPSIEVWDTMNGKKLATLEGNERDVWSLAFSPDGKLLASGSEDRTVRLWDVATGRQVVAFREHQAPVYAVAFSHDGKTLASGSRDGTVKIWDVPASKGK